MLVSKKKELKTVRELPQKCRVQQQLLPASEGLPQFQVGHLHLPKQHAEANCRAIRRLLVAHHISPTASLLLYYYYYYYITCRLAATQ